MTARITSRQIERIKQLLGESLAGLPLSKEVVQARVIGQGGVFKARFTAFVIALATKYFVLLSDEEAHEWLRRGARVYVMRAGSTGYQRIRIALSVRLLRFARNDMLYGLL